MALDQVLKRNFWAVQLPLVALTAFFAARGVTQIVGLGLVVDEKTLATPPAASKALSTAAPPVFHKTNADTILQRNPFDHVTGTLNAPAAVEANPDKPLDLSDPGNAPLCDGVKVLVITASSDPDWSLAVLSAGGDGKTLLRRRGGDVAGKRVEFVGWDRVWLSSTGSLCQAQLFKSPEGQKPAQPAVAAPTPAVESKPPPGGATALNPEIAKGIQRVSATEFNVDRGVVDKILENQADLMRTARIVPEQENGKMLGIRLFGVRPETPLGVLGMENGDRLQTINGFDMTSPEKALEAYARLRTADHLTVQVNRRGANTNLDYNIR